MVIQSIARVVPATGMRMKNQTTSSRTARIAAPAIAYGTSALNLDFIALHSLIRAAARGSGTGRLPVFQPDLDGAARPFKTCG